MRRSLYRGMDDTTNSPNLFFLVLPRNDLNADGCAIVELWIVCDTRCVSTIRHVNCKDDMLLTGIPILMIQIVHGTINVVERIELLACFRHRNHDYAVVQEVDRLGIRFSMMFVKPHSSHTANQRLGAHRYDSISRV